MAETSNKPPMFASVYHHGVDTKRRLQVPSKWRTDGEETVLTLIIWPHAKEQEACIMVYPQEVVNKMIDKLNESSFTDPDADALRRYVGTRSDTAILDKAGRISLPESMMTAIGIDSKAVLVGMIDRFQIWSPEGYERSKAGVDAVAGNLWKSF